MMKSMMHRILSVGAMIQKVESTIAMKNTECVIMIPFVMQDCEIQNVISEDGYVYVVVKLSDTNTEKETVG